MAASMAQNHSRGHTEQPKREIELCFCCARTRLDAARAGRIRDLLRAGVDWPEFVASAIQHGLAPLVFEHLNAVGGDLVPAPWLGALRKSAEDVGKTSLVLLSEALNLCERFDAEQISLIPYKGPVLSWLAYKSLVHRASVDLDFVLEQRHIPRAVSLLTSVGYRAGFDSREAHAGERKHAPGQYWFYRLPQKIHVELHTERTLRYFPVPLDLEGMSRRLISLELGGRTLRTFSVEDTLLMICVHGAKHLWNRLLWICDVAELIQSQPVNWDQAERIATAAKSSRLLRLGVFLAHDLLEAPVPRHILEAAESDMRICWLAAQVRKHLFDNGSAQLGVLKRAAFRVRSRDTLTEGFGHLWRLALRPTETDRKKTSLPEPLLALSRPWRLLRRYGSGFRRRAGPNLAPFIPIPTPMIEPLLRFAEIGPGDVFYDLGCGDGRVVIAAAERFGIRAVGIDFDSRRIAEARRTARRSASEPLVEFRLQDAGETSMADATVVYLYLGSDGNLRVMDRLLSKLRPGARIVSCQFPLVGWSPDKKEQVAHADGTATTLFLWKVPEPGKARRKQA